MTLRARAAKANLLRTTQSDCITERETSPEWGPTELECKSFC
jgi:hypothetical protein